MARQTNKFIILFLLSLVFFFLPQSILATSGVEVKAGFEERRLKLIEALINDPGGNLWHTASKASANIYKKETPDWIDLYHLRLAASADPKCEENCIRCGPNAGFGYWSLPLLTRAYFLFKPGSTYENGRFAGRIDQETAGKIKQYLQRYLRTGGGNGYRGLNCGAVSSIDRWANPPDTYTAATDNHNNIQASSLLLAAQIFKEDPLYKEIYDNWRDYWLRFLDGLAKKGFWETASPTYVERYLAPLVNLYDFAEDPLIKKKAEMILDWSWAEIAQELIFGIRGGAKNRVYNPIAEGPRGAYSAQNDCMYGVYYLYFGNSDFENNPRMPNAEMYSFIFASSNYQPAEVILELGVNLQKRGSYEIKERRKGSCFYWDRANEGDQPYNARRYAYVTPDYILGSYLSDADQHFMSWASWKAHLQNSLVFPTFPEARITFGTSGPITHGHYDVFQHKNVVIASVVGVNDWIGVEGNKVTLRVGMPRGKPAAIFDHYEVEGGWEFIQEGNAYTAIKRLGEILVIEAARSQEYASFNQFKEKIQQNEIQRTSEYFEYTSARGDKLHLPLKTSEGNCHGSCNCNPSEEKLPLVNGQRVDWQDYPLFASPYVNSEWNRGLIEINFNGKSLTLDFRDPNRPVRIEEEPCPREKEGNLDCDSQGLINEIDLTILLNNWGNPFNADYLEMLLFNWSL